MNNYEKIKSMSVDEMAEFITFIGRTGTVPLKFPPPRNKFDKDFDKANDGIKQWLLAESEG